jgi:hypothetical protein
MPDTWTASTAPNWSPAERIVPELLNDLMWMGTQTVNGNPVEQYKHADTRRYINIDPLGRCWRIEVSLDGEVDATHIDLAEARQAVRGETPGGANRQPGPAHSA